MGGYHGRHGANFRMIECRDPARELQRRSRLEAAQVVDRPIILASRHNFQPPLSFSISQDHDPILNAARPVLGAFSYKTFAGFCNPLFIEPLFSVDAVFLHQAAEYGAPMMAMYAIGRYGMMARVPLFTDPINGQVLVQDGQTFSDLEAWLQTLPPPTGSLTGEGGYGLLLQW